MKQVTIKDLLFYFTEILTINSTITKIQDLKYSNYADCLIVVCSLTSGEGTFFYNITE